VAITVAELIKRLSELPTDWTAQGTTTGNIEVRNPNGSRYGWIFADGRPTKLVTSRRSRGQPE